MRSWTAIAAAALAVSLPVTASGTWIGTGCCTFTCCVMGVCASSTGCGSLPFPSEAACNAARGSTATCAQFANVSCITASPFNATCTNNEPLTNLPFQNLVPNPSGPTAAGINSFGQYNPFAQEQGQAPFIPHYDSDFSAWATQVAEQTQSQTGSFPSLAGDVVAALSEQYENEYMQENALINPPPAPAPAGDFALPTDDGGVYIGDGTTPMLLRAADQPPADEVDVSALTSDPADAPATSDDAAPLSVAALTDAVKEMGADATEAGKDLIKDAAELQDAIEGAQIGGMTVKNYEQAADAAKDLLALASGATDLSHEAQETLKSWSEALETPLSAISNLTNGITLANACANGTGDQCGSTAAGIGLSMTAGQVPLGGTITSVGGMIGTQGINNVNQGLNNQMQACIATFGSASQCGGLDTTQQQKDLGTSGLSLFKGMGG